MSNNSKNNQPSDKSDVIKSKFSIFFNEFSPKFNELKEILDKHPNAFHLFYSDEFGHSIEIDEDFLKLD